ncbi:hypothetical protein [Acidovorax sp. 62]|uniref:hypothetical protein n=1 Tax=Acidovorax sp. 62 TaxID=2035203 RepID=UPI0011789E0C|nr:hypothetical protein [Acidovorax sp. 62]
MPLNFLCRSAVGLVAVQAAPVLMLYALALYFQAATASLSNTYQPGIKLLQAVISPSGLLLLVFLVACLRKSYAAARVAMATSAGAILVSALMLAFIAGHGDSPKTWQFPGARSLSSTVQVALFQPSFSNRSIGSVVGNGLLALLVLGGSVYFSRRLRINPVQRTGPHGPSTDLDR